MSAEFGKKHMEAVFDKAKDRIDAEMKSFHTTMGSIPFGAKRLQKRDTVALFDAMVQQFPPEPMMLPDGTVFTESPWVLALQLLDISGGKEFLRQYRTAMQTLPLEELQ